MMHFIPFIVTMILIGIFGSGFLGFCFCHFYKKRGNKNLEPKTGQDEESYIFSLLRQLFHFHLWTGVFMEQKEEDKLSRFQKYTLLYLLVIGYCALAQYVKLGYFRGAVLIDIIMLFPITLIYGLLAKIRPKSQTKKEDEDDAIADTEIENLENEVLLEVEKDDESFTFEAYDILKEGNKANDDDEGGDVNTNIDNTSSHENAKEKRGKSFMGHHTLDIKDDEVKFQFYDTFLQFGENKLKFSDIIEIIKIDIAKKNSTKRGAIFEVIYRSDEHEEKMNYYLYFQKKIELFEKTLGLKKDEFAVETSVKEEKEPKNEDDILEEKNIAKKEDSSESLNDMIRKKMKGKLKNSKFEKFDEYVKYYMSRLVNIFLRNVYAGVLLCIWIISLYALFVVSIAIYVFVEIGVNYVLVVLVIGVVMFGMFAVYLLLVVVSQKLNEEEKIIFASQKGVIVCPVISIFVLAVLIVLSEAFLLSLIIQIDRLQFNKETVIANIITVQLGMFAIVIILNVWMLFMLLWRKRKRIKNFVVFKESYWLPHWFVHVVQLCIWGTVGGAAYYVFSVCLEHEKDFTSAENFWRSMSWLAQVFIAIIWNFFINYPLQYIIKIVIFELFSNYVLQAILSQLDRLRYRDY